MPNEGSYEAALKRSDQIQADLPQHPENYTMLTGDRPTGRLHLGQLLWHHQGARASPGPRRQHQHHHC